MYNNNYLVSCSETFNYRDLNVYQGMYRAENVTAIKEGQYCVRYVKIAKIIRPKAIPCKHQ